MPGTPSCSGQVKQVMAGPMAQRMMYRLLLAKKKGSKNSVIQSVRVETRALEGNLRRESVYVGKREQIENGN